MPIYVLAETPAGYGLFESSDKKLLKRNDLPSELKKSEKILDLLKLKSFTKYESAAAALEESAALAKGQVPPLLSSLLEDMNKESKATVAVADLKLANAITQVPKFDVKAVAGSNLGFLYRSIREHLTSLMPGMTFEDYDRMSLGLGHSISRHRIKFSADKVDSMVCHTVKILDDIDRELNVFAMRLKEWYNWHYPELFKLVNDNILYARLILSTGKRQSFTDADLSDILTEEVETLVKDTAQRSMGTDLGDSDLENCQLLAKQVIQFSDMRRELASYLESRMQAIAPNLTALVGYLVGARLIAHVGTVTGLAKSPASTIQILGAEKALFRALKTKHATPKYGLIYHSSLVGQASGKNKGKVARMLAAKAALGVRIDALSEDKLEDDYDARAEIGKRHRFTLENSLRRLENRPLLAKGVEIGPDGQALGPAQLTLREAKRYNADADGVINGVASTKAAPALKSGKLIEVVESNDVEMNEGDSDAEDDEDMVDGQDAPSSPTLSAVSDDSEDVDLSIPPWQSSIEGSTIEAKKARKKERHERALALADDRKAGRAARKAQAQRRAEREERRRAKAAQDERRATRSAGSGETKAPVKSKSTSSGSDTPQKLSAADLERLAAEAGISVKKFQRKYERGDVKLGSDGTLKVYSKKELKKMRKADEASEEAVGSDEELPSKSSKKQKHKEPEVESDAEDAPEAKPSKKRKHEDDLEDAPKEKKSKKEKKHKKHKQGDSE